MQFSYLAYATVFSQIKLFLASFFSTFSRENGNTVSYAVASIVNYLPKEEVHAVRNTLRFYACTICKNYNQNSLENGVLKVINWALKTPLNGHKGVARSGLSVIALA